MRLKSSTDLGPGKSVRVEPSVIGGSLGLQSWSSAGGRDPIFLARVVRSSRVMFLLKREKGISSSVRYHVCLHRTVEVADEIFLFIFEKLQIILCSPKERR